MMYRFNHSTNRENKISTVLNELFNELFIMMWLHVCMYIWDDAYNCYGLVRQVSEFSIVRVST